MAEESAAAQLLELLKNRDKQLTMKTIKEVFIAEKGMTLEEVIATILKARGLPQTAIDDYLAKRKLIREKYSLRSMRKRFVKEHTSLTMLKIFLFCLCSYSVIWLALRKTVSLMHLNGALVFANLGVFSWKDMLMFSVYLEAFFGIIWVISVLEEHRFFYVQSDSDLYYGFWLGMAIGVSPLPMEMNFNFYQCFLITIIAAVFISLFFGGAIVGLVSGLGANFSWGWYSGFETSLYLSLIFFVLWSGAMYYFYWSEQEAL
ncbi:MAG: hypothetical protein HZB99_02765 [Candidatus Harrisonbacteria bacterium]|nr:hypothetical protein [Candidatus Harrisonbacteria bacterium]